MAMNSVRGERVPLVPPESADVIKRRFGLGGVRFLEGLPDLLTVLPIAGV